MAAGQTGIMCAHVASGYGGCNGRDWSRFVFWRRVLPSFKRIHDIPSLAIVSNVRLVEGDINSIRHRPCRTPDARGYSAWSPDLGPSTSVRQPIRNLGTLKASPDLELLLLLFGWVRIVTVLVHPVLQDLDRSPRESRAGLPRRTLFVVLGFGAGSVPGLHGDKACQRTPLNWGIFLHDVQRVHESG